MKMSGLENLKTKKLRIFKLDDRADMKNFAFYKKAILVMGKNLEEAFSMSLDGKTTNKAAMVAPSNDYLYWARHALVKNELFIFGGWPDRQKVRIFRILRIIESRSGNWKAALGQNCHLD